jgi:hypothetical protein
MQVLPIKGLKSWDALKGLSALLLGYYCLAMPGKNEYESFDQFFESFAWISDEEKEKIIRTAILFVKIEHWEVEALTSFVTDKNGIPYSSASLKNMSLKDLIEIVVAVCLEMGKIQISILSEDEKKKFHASQSISGSSS